MPLETTKNIWHNGKMIAWEDANIHVMSHVIHYGSSVFEGIRCYTQGEAGAGVFRLREHMQRLLDSAKIYRMPLEPDQVAGRGVCRELSVGQVCAGQ
jgi:branched-chain amino acid aminotransferase